MKTSHLLILLSAILCSCTTIYFAQPQPQGSSVLYSFPHDIRGTYIDGDSNQLHIYAKHVEYLEEVEKQISRKEIASSSSIEIKNNLLYDAALPSQKGVSFMEENDTLYYSLILPKKQSLSDSLVLKKYKQTYVLNEKDSVHSYWQVYLLKKIKKDQLQISIALDLQEQKKGQSKKEDYLSKLGKITELKKIDAGTYLIDPTFKEFQRLKKKGAFIELGRYKKIE